MLSFGLSTALTSTIPVAALPFSVFMFCSIADITKDLQYVFKLGHSSGLGEYSCLFRDGVETVQVRHGNDAGVIRARNSNVTMEDDTIYGIFLKFTSISSRSIIIDGNIANEQTHGGTAANPTTVDTLYWPDDFIGAIHSIAIWNEVLADDFILALNNHVEPTLCRPSRLVYYKNFIRDSIKPSIGSTLVASGPNPSVVNHSRSYMAA